MDWERFRFDYRLRLDDLLGGVHRGAPAPELGRLMAEQHPVVRALLAHFFLVTTSSVRGRQREGVASGRGQGALSGRYNVFGFDGLSNHVLPADRGGTG